MLRATSPVCDFSGLRPTVLYAAVPDSAASCSIVGRYRASCNRSWRYGRRLWKSTPGIPGTRRLTFAACALATSTGQPIARCAGECPSRGPNDCPYWISVGDAWAPPPLLRIRPGPRHRRTTDAARPTSTRCTRSLLSGRGPARPTPLDLSQVTDFSYGYPEL
jgi:hypothetical protein